MIVACLGSSTTAGKGQAYDWIGELARRPENQDVRLLNFGVGGDLAYDGLRRLPKVLASRPDRLLVLLGGNDAIAMVAPNARRFFHLVKRLPRAPSSAWFRENMEAIVREVDAQRSIRLALCSLPPIGEDPSSADPFQAGLNRQVEELSGIIKDIAATSAVTYVPFYERLRDAIIASPGPALRSFRFLPFYHDAFRVLVLRKTPDEVARVNGWRFHTDGVHLNSAGGMVLANLVQGFIRDP